MGRTAFRAAHATGPDWARAVKACVDGLGGPAGGSHPADRDGALGFVYLTEALADDLSSVVAFLRQTTRIDHWVGAVGAGVCASRTEYHGDPGVSVMIGHLPAGSFQVMHTVRSEAEAFDVATEDWLAAGGAGFGIVHGDPRNARMPGLIDHLADRTGSHLLGGLTSVRADRLQVADTLTGGGASGVLLRPGVPLVTGLTQGCSPIGPERQVTACQGNIIMELDGRPAIAALREDIGEVLARDLRRIAGYIHAGLPVGPADGHGAAGLVSAGADRPDWSGDGTSPTGATAAGTAATGATATGPGPREEEDRDFLVRPLMAIDLNRGWLSIGAVMAPGETLMFVRRDPNSAQGDLRRMVRSLRGRAGATVRGGLYYSCVGRGPHMFGSPGAELATVSDALGDVPLTGFYANGEINRNRLYGYTGVLALFL